MTLTNKITLSLIGIMIIVSLWGMNQPEDKHVQRVADVLDFHSERIASIKVNNTFTNWAIEDVKLAEQLVQFLESHPVQYADKQEMAIDTSFTSVEINYMDESSTLLLITSDRMFLDGAYYDVIDDPINTLWFKDFQDQHQLEMKEESSSSH